MINMISETGEQLDFEEYLREMKCRNQAKFYAAVKGNTSTEDELYTALIETEKYQERQYQRTDQLLDYDDEIESIEELEEIEMFDISVAGDQLFYANGVLTKNSAGLVHTCDYMLGIVETEELSAMGQQMFKQIKSRYGDKSKFSRFFIGVDKSQQRWSQLNSEYSETPLSPQQPALPQMAKSVPIPSTTEVDW